MAEEEDRIVCYCYQITRNQIIKLAEEKNLKTIGEIRKLTGASTGCGSCRMDVEDILENITARKRRETDMEKRKTIPKNVFKPLAPLVTKVLSNSVIAESYGSQTCHVVIENKDGIYPYVEGQSLGVIPTGTDEKGKNHHLRLYSIASSVSGDNLEKNSVSICVKRVIYQDPETKKTVKGVCSNYICDLKPGDPINLTGPIGQAFLLPEEPNANFIFIATGTGIAPFRAFWRNLFLENRPEKFVGNIYLFFGVPYSNGILYHQEIEELTKKHKNFQAKYAISREEKNSDGSKKYVHHLLQENMTEIYDLLHSPKTHVYLCGLKGMEEGVLEVFRAAASVRRQNWDDLLLKMKKEEKRWEVEVY
jgi:ferredoxin--NADP+ reductase